MKPPSPKGGKASEYKGYKMIVIENIDENK